MQCPRDGTQLSEVRIAGIELDKCHKCDGIWFDPTELEQFRDAGDADIEEKLEQKYSDPAFEEAAPRGYMKCPRCEDGRLQELSYTYSDPQDPVRVDRCNTCFGYWLDDSELDRIVHSAKQIEQLGSESGLGAALRKALLRLARGDT